jgi:hypothetical protein
MMDASREQQLKEQVASALQMVLTEGDVAYMQRLSQEALCQVLEQELYFLGLYSAHDLEAKALVHACLTRWSETWPSLSLDSQSTGIRQQYR